MIHLVSWTLSIEKMIKKTQKPYGNHQTIMNEFIQAIEFGNVEKVRRLLPNVDSSAQNNHAIQCASSNGHAKIVSLLLADDRVNPATHQNWPIRVASRYGHVKVMQLLMADYRVNPTAKDNMAIK